ncbi:tetratricopeptide repeat protein [Thermodesulfobacteriota bacterium]
MKTKNVFNRVFFITAIIVICCITFVWPCHGGEVDKIALEAYELRIQGKVDEAKTLLEQAILENPNKAYAHYELARIQFHMALGLGDYGKLSSMLGASQKSINKAVALEPQNIIYHLFAGRLYFTQAYYGLMTGKKSEEQFTKAIRAYKTALDIKPDYPQAALYLVELYSQFPEDAGGNKSEAEQYAKQLEEMDNVFAAKARSVLLPQETDKVEYWHKVLKKHKGNADVFEELGKAYLGAENVDDAVSCFEKAIKTDPKKVYLFLDLSIYYTFQGMRARNNKELLETSIEKGDAALTRYIDSNPIQPMRAYALGARSKYKSFSGRTKEAQALVKEAIMLDPYFSKATGAPDPDLFFAPPGEISQRHRYLMRPF